MWRYGQDTSKDRTAEHLNFLHQPFLESGGTHGRI